MADRKTRSRNRLVAWSTLLAIFFAQMAIAAYACPWNGEARSTAIPSEEMSTPCPDMDKAPAGPTALCLGHCNAGEQLVDTHPATDDVESLPVLVLHVVPRHVDAVPRSAIEPPLTRITSPPVLASSNRLRI